jgi:hypothetical protein
MAPLPENNTPRVWVGYYDGVNEHEMMIRYIASGATLADVLGFAHDFLLAIDPMLYTIEITGARASASGSTFSFPVLWTGQPSYGDDPMPTLLAPRETRWLGRDNTGRRVSWSIYGGKYTSPDSYRISALDNVNVSNGITAIETAIVGDAFVTINLGDPIVYPYVDVNFNSYWEKEARG